MKKFIVIGVAVAALVGGAVAYAATTFNTYTATQTFTPNHAGTVANPSPFAISEHWKASGTNGHPAAPLTKIVAKNYGEVTKAGSFPTCTAAKINAAGASSAHNWNKACPGGEAGSALIGRGPVTSEFVSPNPPYSVVGTCNPYLWIYNGGVQTINGVKKQVQVFFFTEDNFTPDATKYKCLNGSVHTGAAPAYNGYITPASSANGNMWTLTIPLPTTVSTNAGGTHLYASLLTLDVNYAKKTKLVNGKTVAYGASFACKAGQRPYSFAFTAQNFNGLSPSSQTVTVAHSAACG